MEEVLVIGEIVRRRDARGVEWVSIEQETHPDAPSVCAYARVSEQSNTLHVGPADAWEEFTQEVGLRELFYNQACGLLRRPGVRELEAIDAEVIEAAYTIYVIYHPEASTERGADATHADRCLWYLQWLSWWVTYALKTSPRPGLWYIQS